MNKIKGSARELGKFLSSMFFLKNLGLMILIFLGLFLITNWWMRCYTNHGESVKVPEYVGLSLQKAVDKLEQNSFRYLVSDSIFVVDERPGLVLDQHPGAGASVKKNRTIYLTVTKSTPDLVSLPGLVGNYDYEQYVKKLKLLGLKARIRDRQFNNKLEENTILFFYFGDQKITDSELKEGVKVPMGSILEFVITERSGGTVQVPDLLCMTYAEAEFVITASNLVVGTVYERDSLADRAVAFISNQYPEPDPNRMIKLGTPIDLYLSVERPQDCE